MMENGGEKMSANDLGYTAAPKAPVKAMWVCMIIALILFIAPIPGTIFLAMPVNLAAFILAIVCIVKGSVGQGIIGLIGTSIGATIFYFIGLALFTAGVASMAAPVGATGGVL